MSPDDNIPLEALQGNVVLDEGPTAKIEGFLKRNYPNSYNPTTISNKAGVHHLHVTTSILSRLHKKQHKIHCPIPGFYAFNPPKATFYDLAKDLWPCLHNFHIWIPNNTNPPTGGSRALPPTTPQGNQGATGWRSHTVWPSRSYKEADVPDGTSIVMGVSENPLTIREALWWLSHLRDRYGEERWNEAKLDKVDVNIDLEVKLEGGQVSLRDLQGNLLAIYAKEGRTRVELRNWNPDMTLVEVMEYLQGLVRATPQIDTRRPRNNRGNQRQRRANLAKFSRASAKTGPDPTTGLPPTFLDMEGVLYGPLGPTPERCGSPSPEVQSEAGPQARPQARNEA